MTRIGSVYGDNQAAVVESNALMQGLLEQVEIMRRVVIQPFTQLEMLQITVDNRLNVPVTADVSYHEYIRGNRAVEVTIYSDWWDAVSSFLVRRDESRRLAVIQAQPGLDPWGLPREGNLIGVFDVDFV